MAPYVAGVIRQSEPFGANDTCNHLYLFLRSLQKPLLDFSSVRLQFIYCTYKLAKTSEDSIERIDLKIQLHIAHPAHVNIPLSKY